jgi:type IV pilus assembly protein PilC
MPKFFYIARNAAGQKKSGSTEAATQEEAISQLQAENLIIINIFPEHIELRPGLKEEVVRKSKFKPKHYRITLDDLVLFCRQLSTLLGAGVTILKSLEIISKQIPSRGLFNVIKDLQQKMEQGFSLHQAMAKHPRVFSDLWVNLVESGEASGNLAMVLGRLANYLERNAAFRRKIISALIYPVILFAAGTLALLFLTLKIIPTFADLFKEFNIKLPFLTRLLIGVSIFIKTSGVILFLGIIAGVFLLRSYIRTNPGRKKFESLLFNLPVLGEFFRTLIVERFTSEMATLVESGVPILYSLEITEHSVSNLVMADIIHQVKEGVRDGRSLSRPLERSGFFEPMAVQMVTIGEEIGELPQMFKKLNLFYQEYIEVFLSRFTAMFEPMMLLFMGVIIGIIVIGMFLPIFEIAQIGIK